MRVALLASAVVLIAPFASMRAQEFNPLPEGNRFAIQIGLSSSTLTNVKPQGDQQFSRYVGTPISVRLSRILVGPVVGFLEGGIADRGAKVTVPDELNAELRTRWWDVAGGVSLVGKCLSFVCPALDAGVGFARNRQSILYDLVTGRPVNTVGVTRYETSAVAGVRLVLPQLRGVALVLRHQEGLNDLLTGDAEARSRSQQLLVTLPLNRR